MKPRIRILWLLAIAAVVCALLAVGFSSNESGEAGVSALPEGELPVAAQETTVADLPVRDDATRVAAESAAPAGDAGEMIREARRLLQAREAARAESLVTQAVSFAPENASAWHVLGRTQLARGKRSEAQSSFERACELDPNHAWARNNLGWLHLQQGDWREAVPQLEAAVLLKPHVAVFHNNLGVAYEHARRFEDAAREYALAIQHEPTHPSAGAALARVRAALPPALADSGPVGPDSSAAR
jgi:Tfp pilus assembly protein PilF